MHKLAGLAVILAAYCASVGGAVFTYPNGQPLGCTRPAGYDAEAVCQVPGENPIGEFPVPPAGTAFNDPNFGGALRVLTDTPNWHTYSTISPFSATGRYVAVRIAAETAVLEAATGRNVFSGRPGNVTHLGVLWDGADDDVYYFIAGAQLRKHTLSSNQTETVIDYAVSHGFSSISNGGTGDITRDNWLAFWAPTERQICAVDIPHRKTYCTPYAAQSPANRVPFQIIDFPLMSKGVDSISRKRYVLLMANPAIGVYSVDFEAGTLRFEHRGPELPGVKGNNGDGICDPGESCLRASHSDVFQDASGAQYHLVLEESSKPSCGRFLTSYALSKGTDMVRPLQEGGGARRITLIHACGTDLEWSMQHVGCAKGAAACAVSSSYPGAARNPEDKATPLPRGAYSSEVFVVIDNGREIRRLAQTRSVRFKNNDYWSTARAAMSHDGSQILFASNFGERDKQLTVLLDAEARPTVEPGSAAPVTSVTVSEPEVRALSPANGSGSSGNFTAAYEHPNGASQIYLAYLLFLPTPNVVEYTAKGTCLVEYNRISNGVRLIDNAGTGWLGPLPGVTIAPGAQALQNSQCTIDVARVRTALNENTLTVTVPVTFKSAFAGRLATFAQSQDVTGKWTGMTQFGNWVAFAGATRNGPEVRAVRTPDSGSRTGTAGATVTHTGGAGNLALMSLLVSDSIVSPSSCQIFFFPPNVFQLVNDDGTAMAGAVKAGSPGIAANSRCSIAGLGATAAAVPGGWTFDVPVTMAPGVSGSRSVYAVAFDGGGLVTHWASGGIWTMPN